MRQRRECGRCFSLRRCCWLCRWGTNRRAWHTKACTRRRRAWAATVRARHYSDLIARGEQGRRDGFD